MSADLLALEPTRPLRREEYDRLVELGVFDDENLELLEGRLVPMSPEGSRHSGTIEHLTERLVLALRGRARVRIGHPLAVSDISEPQPDVAVVALGDHRLAHPATGTLAIEVARSSLRKDKLIKPALYAAAGVLEYWVVDLVNDQVIVMRYPAEGGYASAVTLSSGEAIAMIAFPDVVVTVDELLGG